MMPHITWQTRDATFSYRRRLLRVLPAFAASACFLFPVSLPDSLPDLSIPGSRSIDTRAANDNQRTDWNRVTPSRQTQAWADDPFSVLTQYCPLPNPFGNLRPHSAAVDRENGFARSPGYRDRSSPCVTNGHQFFPFIYFW